MSELVESRIRLQVFEKKLLADTLTPVNVYMKLRDVFAGSLLLESSDYHGHQNSLSFICCQPISSFKLNHDVIEVRHPNGEIESKQIFTGDELIHELDRYRESFELPVGSSTSELIGLFGYLCYDVVRYFENIPIKRDPDAIPDVYYKLFQLVIVINHFSNEMTLIEILPEGSQKKRILEKVEQIILSKRFSSYPFSVIRSEHTNLSDHEYLDLVNRGIGHCQMGDVFQIVLSRKFQCSFQGDEFNVYRSLRSINPSPYLFYFDFGSFKLFGSSPEAQLQIKADKVSIFPIAGTFKRTGNDTEDAVLAEQLKKDEKENAEHIMLVDLARNDISKYTGNVTVEVFKEIQYYSHVIHLVSKVTGNLGPEVSILSPVMSSFPAGTLTGAPKHKAMMLINDLEKAQRSFYGGAIGILGLSRYFNHAIMIRTFKSINNTLTYQAGAGIVASSDPHNELQEVHNKLNALRRAIQKAEKI